MLKDFNGWNAISYKIQNRAHNLFNEREIWWSTLGINIGDEEDGKGSGFSRPIIIVKKFNTHLLWGIPLSMNEKINPYYRVLCANDGINRFAMLSQLRILDTKRLTRKISVANINSYNELIIAVKSLFKTQNGSDKKPLESPRAFVI
ncbi:MAG: type II toxin-antitoxin system PemK/MazF family toxin [Candidatus Liptonbacteria bacterium]